MGGCSWYTGVWLGGAHRDDVFDATVNVLAIVPGAFGLAAVCCKRWGAVRWGGFSGETRQGGVVGCT